MKKWILLLFILLVIVIGGVCFFVPRSFQITETTSLAVNNKAFARNILEERNWKKWWPTKIELKKDGSADVLVFNNKTYSIIEKKLTSAVVAITTNSDTVLSELFFLPLSPDSINLQWAARVSTTANPIDKLQTFFKTNALKKDLHAIIESMQQHYAVETNLYELPIQKDKVQDSTLISTFTITQGYPATGIIYQLVDQLNAYAQKNGAKQSGIPMLNINTADSISYRTQVALPINKKLKDSGNIAYRWMLGGGNILVTEVKGGPYNINKAFVEMEKYVQDFQRTAPAIPFQSLVTDRRKEPDTSKWITRVYWPVM